MDQLIWHHIMRAKSVARKLANNMNINSNSGSHNENDDNDVNVGNSGNSMAYKGKGLQCIMISIPKLWK